MRLSRILMVLAGLSFSYCSIAENTRVYPKATCEVVTSDKSGKEEVHCIFRAYGKKVTFLSDIPNSYLSFYLTTTKDNPDCAFDKKVFVQLRFIAHTQQFIAKHPDWCVGVLATVNRIAVASFAHHGKSFKDNTLHQKTVRLKKLKGGYAFVPEK